MEEMDESEDDSKEDLVDWDGKEMELGSSKVSYEREVSLASESM